MFYTSKAIPMDVGYGKFVLATIRLDIETKQFQVRLGKKSLILRIFALNNKLETTDESRNNQIIPAGKANVINTSRSTRRRSSSTSPGQMCRVLKMGQKLRGSL